MHIEIKLEALTPLFLAGAKPIVGANQLEAELRPSSVRGELRYWFRVGLGGMIGDKNLSLLADLEASVFGDTGSSSPVIIRLSAPDRPTANHPLLPHRPDAGQARAFPNGTKFNLILSLSPRGSMQQLEWVTWTALLWLTLGGLGRRSRRAAGSVRIRELVMVPDSFSTKLKETLQLATTQAKDPQQLAMQIETIVRNARNEFGQLAPVIIPKPSDGLPSFSILQDSTRIVVKQSEDADPQIWLMKMMSALKRTQGSKHFAEAFGGIGQDNFGGSRRASPLHVTLHQTQNGAALLFTYLAARVLADKEGSPEEGYRFFDSLSGFPVKLTGGER